jgi:hypothetical protein
MPPSFIQYLTDPMVDLDPADTKIDLITSEEHSHHNFTDNVLEYVFELALVYFVALGHYTFCFSSDFF